MVKNLPNEFKKFCETYEIINEIEAPYSPQQNNLVEKNRTLIEMINSMLISSGIPNNLWEETLLTYCDILNWIPYKKYNITSYEL